VVLAAIVRGDETKTLGCVEEFYSTVHGCHFNIP
jgi:hypothetical protein